jgi:hypothetical protein
MGHTGWTLCGPQATGERLLLMLCAHRRRLPLGRRHSTPPLVLQGYLTPRWAMGAYQGSIGEGIVHAFLLRNRCCWNAATVQALEAKAAHTSALRLLRLWHGGWLLWRLVLRPSQVAQAVPPAWPHVVGVALAGRCLPLQGAGVHKEQYLQLIPAGERQSKVVREASECHSVCLGTSYGELRCRFWLLVPLKVRLIQSHYAAACVALFSFYPAVMHAGTVAHQQVVRAVNVVAQVALEHQSAGSAESQAATQQAARSAVEEDVGRCISLLLAGTKGARSVAAARILQVMELSGKRGVVLLFFAIRALPRMLATSLNVLIICHHVECYS